jgi:hypothetical protein
MLWPEVAEALSASPQIKIESIRRLGSVMLLLPGSGRPLRDLVADADGRFRRDGLAYALSMWSDSRIATTVLRSVVELARSLREGPPPIDYARRQQIFRVTELIDCPTWLTICRATDFYPGQGRRLRYANAYMFEVLTGAHPAERDDSRDLDESIHWTTYREFCIRLEQPVVEALHRHAVELLDRHRIAEPLQWTPPAEYSSSLVDLRSTTESVKPARVHQLLLRGDNASEVANVLGVSLEHLRLILLHDPIPDSRMRQQRMVAANFRKPRVGTLSVESISESLESGSTLRQIEAETGHSRNLLRKVLLENGLPVPPSGRQAQPLDLEWFFEEYWNKSRTLPDIAAELGMTPTNLGRRVKDSGVALRRRGGAGQASGLSGVDPSTVPSPLREALQGVGAAQRLERIAELSKFDSITDAANVLGVHQSALSTQVAKVESRVGKRILERHPQGPGPAQRLTATGELLLKQYANWSAARR